MSTSPVALVIGELTTRLKGKPAYAKVDINAQELQFLLETITEALEALDNIGAAAGIPPSFNVAKKPADSEVQ